MDPIAQDPVAHVRAKLAEAVETLKKEGVIPSEAEAGRLGVEAARKSTRDEGVSAGTADFVVNAALTLAAAKALDLGRRLAATLESADGIEKAEVAGPGFINVTLSRAFWTGMLRAIALAGRDYGRRGAAGAENEKVSVALVLDSPANAFDAGLYRAAAFADAMANILVFSGCEAAREDLTPKSNSKFTNSEFYLAYHRDRLRRGFRRFIAVLGPGPGQRVKEIGAAFTTLTEDNAAKTGGVNRKRLDIMLCQPVRLIRTGKLVVTHEEDGACLPPGSLADQSGRDVTRFMMLLCRNNTPLDLDVVKMMEQCWDNPAFYVQYAHARACSALRNSQDAVTGRCLGEKQLHASQLHLLTDGAELNLIKRLSYFPRVIESAAERCEPHRVALFLYDLARDFHGLWNRSKESPQLQFNVCNDWELTRARMALVAVAAQTMQTGLSLLGVKAIAEMR